MKTYRGLITTLEDNQVFVFGSNLSGFHGGGAAGFASFGPGKNWRDFHYSSKPDGWKGLWNVKGCAEGFQEGLSGKSYAIPTVTEPGARRSISLEEIRKSVLKFYGFAQAHPELEFLVAYSSKGANLNGYSPQEMAIVFLRNPPLDNVIFEEGFSKLIPLRD